ncbi:MAG: hypothetical protein GYB53_24215 [Rhodobacteraceae bacterium]|nr:hypothetical protein [Paracoccaceae bacterium]MBR9821945.1 hypothetical protein [Paracoccaceae bacterium]
MLTPDQSARIMADWASRKAAQGNPIAPERLARLTPQHLSRPASADMAEVIQIAGRARLKVREIIARDGLA